MANYFARKAGNIDATDVWATTPSGTAAAQTFVSGDVLYANSFAITVNVSTNLGSTGEVRNDNTNSATAGGGFTLSNGVTLTANVFAGSTGTACVTYSGTSGNSATITGNVTGGSAGNAHAVNNTSTGTLTVNGNCIGGTQSNASGVNNNSSGIVNINGNLTGGGGTTTAGALNTSTGTINLTGNSTGGTSSGAHGAINNSTGTINITGTCTGGTTSSGTAAGANNNSTGTINITGNCLGSSGGGSGQLNVGVSNTSTGTINITGNCTGGSGSNLNYGARNLGAGILSITGNCTGSSSTTAVGAINESTGQMSVNGSIFASEQTSGVGGGARGQVTRLTGPFYTSPTFGVNPNTCLAWRWASTLNANTFIEVPTTNLTSTRNLVTPDNATNFPAASDVRSGVTYGISGALTGTCAVPPAASVAIGVPVDNTTGSAFLTASSLWDYLLSSATVSGSVGQKLRRVATPADIVALA